MLIYYSVLLEHWFPWRCLCHFLYIYFFSQNIVFFKTKWTAWNIRNFYTNIQWPRLNHYRITERWGWSAPLQIIWSNPPLTRGSATAGWWRLCPVYEVKDSTTSLAICSSTGSLPQWKTFFLCLNGIIHIFLYLNFFFFVFQVFSL